MRNTREASRILLNESRQITRTSLRIEWPPRQYYKILCIKLTLSRQVPVKPGEADITVAGYYGTIMNGAFHSGSFAVRTVLVYGA
jgi:hypothetical protein